jgi:ribosomal protein L15
MSGTMRGGNGMMGGRGMHGMMGNGAYTGTMPMHGAMIGANGMHEQVWTAIAAELDMTYAELNTAVQNGQTVAQLAEANGVSLDELKSAAKNAHQTALADLVEQGVLTQEQADWMLDHMNDMPMFNLDQGFGPGMMRQGRGMMGGHGPGGMMHNRQPPAGPQG